MNWELRARRAERREITLGHAAALYEFFLFGSHMSAASATVRQTSPAIQTDPALV